MRFAHTKLRVHFLRAQVKWVEASEKNTKLFFALEKSNSRRKSIHKLECTKDNTIIDTNEKILTELETYYQQLFSFKETIDDPSYLNDIVIPQVTSEDKVMLDSPIMMEEMLIVIKQLAQDKCPGPDGYQMNFITAFLPELKHTLHTLILQIAQKGVMHGSGKEGIIALMEKPNKNLLKIAHWRPLAMLNSEYKIYAKILANRLQLVLPYLISNRQVGFMRGRNISKKLSELLTVIDFCEQNNVRGDYHKH